MTSLFPSRRTALFWACALLCACVAEGAVVKPNMARPPMLGPLEPYHAPARQSWLLSNGIPVVLVTDRRFPLVTVRLAVRGGSALLAPEDAGLADAMAELLTAGTSRRSARRIAEETDEFGGELSAEASPDSVVVSAFSLSDRVEPMLNLLADVALDPIFPKGEVELRRKNMLEELKIDRSDPDFLASVAFHRKLYPGHPYGIVAPTEASIARITRSRLRKLRRRIFSANNALIVATGDIGKEELARLLEARFSSWRAAGPALPETRPPAAEAEPRVVLVNRADSAQSVIILGNPAITERNPDYFALLVANEILGGSFSSRLMNELRERQGYTYDVYSRLGTLPSAGFFFITTQVRNQVTGPALKEAISQLKLMRSREISPGELEQAKNILVGRFARGLETQAGVADHVLHDLLYGLPAGYLDTYVEKIRSITPADVKRAASLYMLPGRLLITVVGDAARVAPELQGLAPGPLQRVGVDGEDLRR